MSHLLYKRRVTERQNWKNQFTLILSHMCHTVTVGLRLVPVEQPGMSAQTASKGTSVRGCWLWVWALEHECTLPHMTRAWVSLRWLKRLKLSECFSCTKILLTLAFGSHQFCLHVTLVSSKDTPDKMSGSSCSQWSNTHSSSPSHLPAFAPSLSTPHPLTHIPKFSLLLLRHTL